MILPLLYCNSLASFKLSTYLDRPDAISASRPSKSTKNIQKQTLLLQENLVIMQRCTVSIDNMMLLHEVKTVKHCLTINPKAVILRFSCNLQSQMVLQHWRCNMSSQKYHKQENMPLCRSWCQFADRSLATWPTQYQHLLVSMLRVECGKNSDSNCSTPIQAHVKISQKNPIKWRCKSIFLVMCVLATKLLWDQKLWRSVKLNKLLSTAVEDCCMDCRARLSDGSAYFAHYITFKYEQNS